LSLCFLILSILNRNRQTKYRFFTFCFFSLESYEAPRENLYSEKTLTLSCLGSTLAALVAGCLLGFLASRRYTQRHSYLKCGHAYLEAQSKLDR
jgi:hypothetical protein